MYYYFIAPFFFCLKLVFSSKFLSSIVFHFSLYFNNCWVFILFDPILALSLSLLVTTTFMQTADVESCHIYRNQSRVNLYSYCALIFLKVDVFCICFFHICSYRFDVFAVSVFSAFFLATGQSFVCVLVCVCVNNIIFNVCIPIFTWSLVRWIILLVSLFLFWMMRC